MNNKVDKPNQNVSTIETEENEKQEFQDIIDIHDEFYDILQKISLFKMNLTSLQNDLRGVEKKIKKRVRTLNRQVEKKKYRKKTKPSGFAKPVRISDELCDFLKLEKGTLMARTEVTKKLSEYVKEHNLQDKLNKRKIIPDNRLKNLLKISNETELTYFNIQTFMNIHYV